MADYELVQMKNGHASPAIMWGYAVSWELRPKKLMPRTLPTDATELEKLESDIAGALAARLAELPVDQIACDCGRQFPDFPDLATCPYCGIALSEDTSDDGDGGEEDTGDDDDDDDYDADDGEEEGDDEEPEEPEEPEEDAEEEPIAAVPDPPNNGAVAVATFERSTMDGRKRRLAEIHSEIARWNATDVRSIWERGRLLHEVRENQLFATMGCKNFMHYLAETGFQTQVAYRWIEFYEACPEDAVQLCEGMSFHAMMEFSRQSAEAVKGLADGAKRIHAVFRCYMETAQEERKQTGRAVTGRAVKQIAAKAESIPGPAASAKASRTAAPDVAPEVPKKRGRPRSDASAAPEQPSLPMPAPTQPTPMELVPFAFPDGTIQSPGVGAYIHKKSGKSLGRPEGNIVGHCIHLHGADGRFLRIVLGKNSYSWTVERKP